MKQSVPPSARSTRWLLVLSGLAATLTILLLFLAWNALERSRSADREKSITLARTLSYAISGLVRETPDTEGRLSSILEEVAQDDSVRSVGIIQPDGVAVLQRGREPLPRLSPMNGKEQLFTHGDLFIVVSPFEIRRGCASGSSHSCGCGGAKSCKCTGQQHWVIPPGNYGLAMSLTPAGRHRADMAVLAAAVAAILLLCGFVFTAMALLRSIRTNTTLTNEIALAQQRRTDLESAALAAAGLAHEIRNPLGAISGYAQLLHENLATGEAKERVALMMRELVRVQDRLEEFLAFSRKQSAGRQRIDLLKSVEESIVLLIVDAQRLNVTVALHASAGPCAVDADPYRLKELITNLLLNALQACGTDGRVDISLKNSSTGILLEICDSGPGITETDLSRVFEPYFTTRVGGTGLGLAISRRIADDHGALLTLENRVEGGVKAALVFPAAHV